MKLRHSNGNPITFIRIRPWLVQFDPLVQDKWISGGCRRMVIFSKCLWNFLFCRNNHTGAVREILSEIPVGEYRLYIGSVIKTKIQDFYYEPIWWNIFLMSVVKYSRSTLECYVIHRLQLVYTILTNQVIVFYILKNKFTIFTNLF